jgi:hypothetical protein
MPCHAVPCCAVLCHASPCVMCYVLANNCQVSAHGTGATIPPVDEQVVSLKMVTPAGKGKSHAVHQSSIKPYVARKQLPLPSAYMAVKQ